MSSSSADGSYIHVGDRYGRIAAARAAAVALEREFGPPGSDEERGELIGAFASGLSLPAGSSHDPPPPEHHSIHTPTSPESEIPTLPSRPPSPSSTVSSRTLDTRSPSVSPTLGVGSGPAVSGARGGRRGSGYPGPRSNRGRGVFEVPPGSSSGPQRRQTAAAADPPVVDFRGNRLPQRSVYVLLKTPAEGPEPGIYTGTWADLEGIIPGGKLPCEGYNYRKSPALSAAREVWHRFGHRRTPPEFILPPSSSH